MYIAYLKYSIRGLHYNITVYQLAVCHSAKFHSSTPFIQNMFCDTRFCPLAIKDQFQGTLLEVIPDKFWLQYKFISW